MLHSLSHYSWRFRRTKQKPGSLTINGFDGPFAFPEWEGTPNPNPGGGTGSIVNPNLVIRGSATDDSSYEFKFNVADSGIEQYVKDNYDPRVVFVGGTVSFDWEWAATGANLPPFSRFTYAVTGINAGIPVELPTLKSGGNFLNIADYNLSGSSSFNVLPNSVFSFKIENTLPGLPATTGTINNFTFTGRFVPGPLPLMAPVAAFAWSRKLRRRLVGRRQQVG